MPNCFKLINKQTNTAEQFNIIDDKIRNHVGAPPDDQNFYKGWYDTIGLMVAAGYSLTEIRDIFKDMSGFVEIIDFLIENYSTDAWAEVGGRR